MQERVGQRYGDFVVDSPLGRGGMGVVYRVTHVRTRRQYALKLLAEAAHADSRARFAREARVLAGLGHPGIVAVHDFDLEADTPWLVMDLLEGEDLAERLDRGPIPFMDAVSLFDGIAAAMDAAHRVGVLHRDIKPANVFIDAAGRPMLLDFGLAKPSQADATRLTMTGVAMGTPAYMSPEQARADSVDVRTDVYSLGALFFEMIVGEPPYMAPNPTALLAKVLMDPPPRVTTRTTTPFPAGVDELVARAMAKQAEARTPDVATLRDEVRMLAGRDRLPSGGEAVAATRMAPRSVPPTQATPAAMVAALTPRPPRQRRRWGLVVSAAVLVAAVSSGAAWVWARGEDVPVHVPVATPPLAIDVDAGEARLDAGSEVDAGADASDAGHDSSRHPRTRPRESPRASDPAAPSMMPTPEPEIAAAIAAIEQSDWRACLDAVRGVSTSRALQMRVSCALQIPDRSAARGACAEHMARYPNHPFSRSCPNVAP